LTTVAHENHGGPAARAGLATGDIVCTAAGFGADMGAEKFFDIKCRASGLRPDAAVMVATIRAVKMHGGVGRIVAGKPLDPALTQEDVEAVIRGAANLAAQVENVRVFEVPVVVAINAYPTDSPAEIAAVQEVALAGEHHGHAELVGALDVRLVAHRSPRLHDHGHARSEATGGAGSAGRPCSCAGRDRTEALGYASSRPR